VEEGEGNKKLPGLVEEEKISLPAVVLKVQCKSQLLF
jgi:hypothetical protein